MDFILVAKWTDKEFVQAFQFPRFFSLQISLTHHRDGPLSPKMSEGPVRQKTFHPKNLVCQNYDENYLEFI